MNDKERQVVEKLLADILAAGHAVSVLDIEADALPLPSRDKQEILEMLDQTGEDVLVVVDKSGAALGDIRLIYDDWGDAAGPDVIADYSTALEPLLAGAEALAESLANAPAAPPAPPADPGIIFLHAAGKTLQVHISYNYCTVCGHTPTGSEEPNYAPIRFWDPDDGWKIGTLCRWCADEVVGDQPKPEDFAWRNQEHIDDSGTDEDVLLVFEVE